MLNTVVLMGRFTEEPNIKSLDSDKKVMKFCLAVERSQANKKEERKTDFIDCIAWEKTAEFISKYFEKGDAIIVEGRIETRQYEDKQGNKRKSIYVLVNNVNFCALKKGENNQSQENPQKSRENNSNNWLNDEDLPF